MEPDRDRPHGLWSLWDMIKITGDRYLVLGGRISDTYSFLEAAEGRTGGVVGKGLTTKERAHLQGCLQDLLNECHTLDMPVSKTLLLTRMHDSPETTREMKVILDAVIAELKTKTFVFVPSDKAKFYEVIFPSLVSVAFPSATKELEHAGNCLALGENTASVFHSMRAAEIGVRALGTELKIVLPKPIELADWQEVLNGITAPIKAIENLPRSTAGRDADLQFYSEAAAQLRFFKNAWRVQVAHARETYEEPEAVKVFDHTLSLFQTLATRLKE
jgi:hypothetical protein